MNVNNGGVTSKTLSPELKELKDEMKHDMEALITPLKASIDALLQIKQAWEVGIEDCRTLQEANVTLTNQLIKVENDNKHLQDRVRHLEDKLLEGNVILQGIPDALWEPVDSTKEKVLTAIAHTISCTSHKDKMDRACKIPIKDIQRKGKYTALRARPVEVGILL